MKNSINWFKFATLAMAAFVSHAAWASLLPAGYQELTYIESNGRQWLDTGYKPISQKTGVIMRFNSGTYVHTTAFFGTGWTNGRFLFNQQSGKFMFHGQSHSLCSKSPGCEMTVTITPDGAGKGVLVIDNPSGNEWQAYTNSNVSLGVDSATLKLFGFSNGYRSSFKLYRFTVTERAEVEGVVTNDPVHDFVPCVRRADNAIGLYDILASDSTAAFKTTGGSDPFLKGENVYYEDSLAVSGNPFDLGEVSPPYGYNVGYEVGESVPCLAPVVWTNEAQNTAATCLGYKVYTNNAVYVEGTGNSFTLIQPNSALGAKLVWQWKVEYKVTASASAGGSAAPAEQWVEHGGVARVAATGEDVGFGLWGGDAVSRDNPLNVVVSGPMAVQALFGRTIYVATTGDDATVNPYDAATPCRTINAAVAIAAPGDNIEIAAGDHTLANVGEDLLLDKAVVIRGVGATPADVVIRPDTSADTHRFLNISNANAIVENMTFTGCNILNDDRSEARRRSPMRLYDGMIRNCVFRNNVQLNHGTLEVLGGLVADCTFDGNRSKSDSIDHGIGRGGALFQNDGVVSNCVFRGNYARNHGGAAIVYGGLMTHCCVTNNTIERSAGSGVVIAGGTLAHSFVSRNSVSSGKGAVAIITGELRDSVVCSNSASVSTCGGVYIAALSGNYLNSCEYDDAKSRTMTGCRVFGNTSGGEGAGVCLISDSTVDHCTIYGNRSTSEVGSGLYQTAGTVRNTIVFGNGIKTDYDADNVCKNGGSFIYSCTQPAVVGDGNVDNDPLFTDIDSGDVTLRPGSPCIGAGRTADLSETCDMGALPYAAGVDPVRCGFTVSKNVLSAAGSVTLRGYADGADLSGLAFKWDFNGDGVVDATGADVVFDVAVAGIYSVALWLEDSGGARIAEHVRENVISLKLSIAYVNQAGSNIPPYATPETGAHELSDAIDAVSATDDNPGEIIVMDGTYKCPAAQYIVDKPLYIHSENGPGATILQGWNSGSKNADYRVMKVDHPMAVVAGLTLENGNWNGASFGDEGCGGVRIISGVVSNCVIRNSTGCDLCGGVNVRGGTLTRSVVYGNTSYRGNNGSAAKAGGVYQTGGFVEHCVISNNTACNGDGGCGLYITGGTTTCSRIVGNYGLQREITGGIGVFMSGGRVERCEIVGNGVRDTGNANVGGGVKMSGGALVNCFIAGNRSNGSAAGVYQTGGTVENCTITDNASTTLAGSGLYIGGNNAVARNNIIYGNGAGVAAEANCNLQYSSARSFANNIVSPASAGTGNLDSDPLFTNPPSGNYVPSAGSPAIDAAMEIGLAEDILGMARPKDGDDDGVAQPDIGCYEAPGSDEGELRCSFTMTERVGYDSVTSTFTANVAGNGAKGDLIYEWDFGRGVITSGSASSREATVVFSTYGVHAVSLKVTTGDATAVSAVEDCIKVGARKAYVNQTGNGTWPYATPETATNDLVEVFGSAIFISGIPYEVEVADGEYVIRDKWIVLSAEVFLHSGNGRENCRLVADATRDSTLRKAIFVNNDKAVVDGFTLDSFCWDGNLKGDQGGVVRISAGTVRNCVIQNSRGGNNGAAVDMSGGVLENSILRNNWSVGGNNSGVGSGGGVFLSSGSPIVRNTVISNNFVASSGGGIYCNAAGAVVTNCIIAYNRTSYSSRTSPMNNSNRHGGGVYANAAATFANCAIIGNHARGEGGGVYATAAAKFINCLIADNAANTTRPGVYMTAAGQFLNCTISGNGTNAVANAIACEITGKASFKNNIVWGNADCATELSLASGATASGNCSEDPHFKKPVAGDYRLLSNSKCINAGDTSVWSGAADALDLDGNPRVKGKVDIGCYECQARGLMFIVR